jgi:hypothetical protein
VISRPGENELSALGISKLRIIVSMASVSMANYSKTRSAPPIFPLKMYLLSYSKTTFSLNDIYERNFILPKCCIERR